MVTEMGELTSQHCCLVLKQAGKSMLLEVWLKVLFGPEWCFRDSVSFKDPQGWDRCLCISFPLHSAFIQQCWIFSISSCLSTESLCRMAELNGRIKRAKKCETQKHSNHPMFAQLISCHPFPLLAFSWDWGPRLTGVPCLWFTNHPARQGWVQCSERLSRSISVSWPCGALEWSSGKGAERAEDEGMRAETP